MEEFDPLKLSNQLCFPIYACAREIQKAYTPFLEEIDLTYTQYITMMVMWERKEISFKELGNILFLDSGTLTPVIKNLEKKGFVEKERSKEDERNVNVRITKLGEDLKDKAKYIPQKMVCAYKLPQDEGAQLYSLIYKLLNVISENK